MESDQATEIGDFKCVTITLSVKAKDDEIVESLGIWVKKSELLDHIRDKILKLIEGLEL
jgi:hypothetical protein